MIPPYPLTNFEIQAYYQNEARFNRVFSRDNLPNIIKNGAYVINLDEYRDIGTHWVALYVNNKTVTYFDSFGVEHIPKNIMKLIDNKNIITNIFRIQVYDSSLVKKKTDFDSKITEVEGKIPNISGLATNSALTTVENKILDVTNLVTKTDFDVKLKALSDRVTKNKSKDLLLDNELKKLKAFDTDYFEGKNYFEGDNGAQYTLVFQVTSIYF